MHQQGPSALAGRDAFGPVHSSAVPWPGKLKSNQEEFAVANWKKQSTARSDEPGQRWFAEHWFRPAQVGFPLKSDGVTSPRPCTAQLLHCSQPTPAGASGEGSLWHGMQTQEARSTATGRHIFKPCACFRAALPSSLHFSNHVTPIVRFSQTHAGWSAHARHMLDLCQGSRSARLSSRSPVRRRKRQ